MMDSVNEITHCPACGMDVGRWHDCADAQTLRCERCGASLRVNRFFSISFTDARYLGYPCKACGVTYNVRQLRDTATGEWRDDV